MLLWLAVRCNTDRFNSAYATNHGRFGTDGTLDSTTTKATLVTAMEYLKSRRSTIRSNIESRYSDIGVSATIPAFESYAFKLDTIAPTVVSITPSDSANISSSSYNFSVTFSERMDNTTLTINTGLDCSGGQNGTSGGGMCRGTCSASFEYSSDDFVSCVQMTDMTLAVSNSGKTFTMNSSMHSTSTAYKFRVTSGAKDFGGGNSVSTHTVSYTTQWSPDAITALSLPNGGRKKL